MKIRSLAKEVGDRIPPASFGMDPVTVVTVIYYVIRIGILCWKETDANGKADAHDVFWEFAASRPRSCRIRTARTVRQAERRAGRRITVEQSYAIADAVIARARASSREEFEEIYQEALRAQNDLDPPADHAGDVGSGEAGSGAG
jgi:hypothetical protein